jgi:hypothetical protein
LFGKSLCPVNASREKETIAKMIALYEKQCPQASQEEGHYQALNAYADKRLDKCVLVRKSPPVNSVRYTATSLPNVKR